MLVLKLGGSLITDKSQPYRMRRELMDAASREVKACMDEGLVDGLAIVHGVGSYGHPPVIKHKLHKGFIDPGQLLPISQTQAEVNELRMAMASSLLEAGVPVNLLHTSSVATAEGGLIVSMHLDAVRGFRKVGMVPLMGGDMVQDTRMGFSVGSGDRVAVLLAKELGATDLVFATDVDGVYDGDPKADPGARLLGELSLGSGAVGSGSPRDASGAMRGKLGALEALREEMEAGMRVSVMSMMEPGNLRRLLLGEAVGTRVLP